MPIDDRSDAPATPAVRDVWFERAGTRLYAADAGGGPPLVALHGGIADHRAARHAVAALADRCRLITPDLRGSGRSHHAGPLTWDDLADDVAALMDHLGLARAVVAGTSFGSGVALRVAARHPARTAGLVLLRPVFPGADRPLAPASAAAMAALDAFGRRAVAEGVGVFRPLFERLPDPIRAVALEMLAGFDPASVAATTAFLAGGGQPIAAAADLGALAMPAVVVPGDDPEHPAEVAALYAAHLPDCTVADAGSAAAAIWALCRRVLAA
jgi:haloacetate dehalogenase